MIGIDIVNIERFEKFLDRNGQRALEKFLSSDEIQLRNSSSSYAGFWAAKEAISKALGTGIGKECSFFDIQLYHDKNNAPHFKLKEKIIKKYNIKDMNLSITHDGGFAVAVCMIEGATDTKKVLSF